MTDSTRLLLSVEPKTIELLDSIVKQINDQIETWRSKTNRQAVINGLVKFALKQEVTYNKGYGKDITVQLKK